MAEKVVTWVLGKGADLAVSSTLDWAKAHRGSDFNGEVANALVSILESKEDKILDAVTKLQATTEKILNLTKDINTKLDTLSDTITTAIEISSQLLAVQAVRTKIKDILYDVQTGTHVSCVRRSSRL